MAKPDRKERLAEQLRANLKKRKAQMRARDALTGSQKPIREGTGDTLPKTPNADQPERDED